MALFDIFKKQKEKQRFEQRKKEKPQTIEKKEVSKEKKQEALPKASNFAVNKDKKEKEAKSSSRVVFRPHVTEKATALNENGVYVFEIGPRFNSTMVKQKIKELYGVQSRKINIINSPAKKFSMKGRQGVKPGIKKAMVYLKKGDKIDIV